MVDLKWLALILWCLAPAARAADDLESLDADFLSYLAEFEGENDDWTIVESAPSVTTVAPSATKEPKSSAVEAVEKPTTTPASQPGRER